LRAAENRLVVLPQSIRQLARLRELLLHDNPQLRIPREILGPEGNELYEEAPASPSNILDYYFRARRSRRPLNEAKLILVGRGGVGKTCLIKRLLRDTFDEHERETPGIEIGRWETKVSSGDKVRLHVWDFGGQEILHATHRFFLTERTLYLLVLSGREGKPGQDAEYWLQLIKSFGGDSKVIVALNKSSQHAFDVNRRYLQEKYPTIVEFVKTDCKTQVGLKELKDTILVSTEELEHRKVDFPADWFAIKERLAGMKEDFVTWEKYRHICLEHGEKDADAQRALAGYLHILGIALNYADDPRLHDTHVLNPRWVTEGIYPILRSRSVRDCRGVLKAGDLSEILSAQRYPQSKHDFLLRLMERFQLCFRLPGSKEQYLVPELLGENQPDIRALLDEVGLGFRYQYEVLPEGLLPRFIVQTHTYSEATPQWRWRTGVVLEWDGCRAVIRADHQERRADIYIVGPEMRRRELLAIVRAAFEQQHRELKGLAWEERVPLAEDPTITVSYNDLRKREERGELEFYPENFDTPVSVRELLNGIDVPELRPQNAAEMTFQKVEHHHHYSATSPTFTEIGMQEEIKGDKIEQKIISSSLVDSPVIANTQTFHWTKTVQQLPEGQLKPELEKLIQLVEHLVNSVPVETAEKAKENLEVMIKQAAKPNPDKNWLKLSSAGLKEAAESVAGMSGPILEVLDRIRAFLGF